MIPIRKRKDNLFIVLILVGEIFIVNDEGSTQTVRVLSSSVTVIPIGTWLLDLWWDVSIKSGETEGILSILTVKLYVKLVPGTIGH